MGAAESSMDRDARRRSEKRDRERDERHLKEVWRREYERRIAEEGAKTRKAKEAAESCRRRAEKVEAKLKELDSAIRNDRQARESELPNRAKECIDQESELESETEDSTSSMGSCKILHGDQYEDKRIRNPFGGVFDAVKDRGQLYFTDWAKRATGEPVRWKREIILRANMLVQTARKRNFHGAALAKTTWDILEHTIFEHLRYEPWCSSCNGRLWKPDISLSSRPADDECNCSPESIGLQYSRRFADATPAPGIEHGVPHGRINSDARIFGLLPEASLGSSLDLLLLNKETSKRISDLRLMVDERLPQNPARMHNILPFLACVPDIRGRYQSTHELRHHVGIAMSRVLLVQSLVVDVAEEEGQQFRPFAWCLAYKGSHTSECMLFAASFRAIRECKKLRLDKDPSVQVWEVWEGSLTLPDSALQILLLIDYIAEWSREIYSKQISACFHSMASKLKVEGKQDTLHSPDSSPRQTSPLSPATDRRGLGSGKGKGKEKQKSVYIDLKDNKQEEGFTEFKGRTIHPRKFEQNRRDTL